MSNGDTGTSRGGRRQRAARSGRGDGDDERYEDEEYGDDERYDDERYDDEEYDADGYEPDPDEVTDEEPDADEEPRPSPARVAQAGLRQIAELTGKPVIGITSLDRSDTGWVIGVEVVEDRRIPSSADVLAVYRTELDAAGQLVGYRRTRRYPRGRGDSGDAEV
ncbi:gas vesicle protein GvpO [Phytohabitans kaempferiae]|uniref:Gas vesicle protein GvpO n=1 Tax=Phytohabitans kaempferiae TaxID=1620943 RepID=A0ABV6MG03_9ACTN